MAARSLLSEFFTACPAGGRGRQRACEMPRYEYKCRSCDRNFEVTHGINDSVETCEECGGDVRRVFHPIGVIFKGSGFYATDAKKPSNKPPVTPERDHKDDKAEDKPKPDGNGDKKKDEKKPEKSDSSAKSSS